MTLLREGFEDGCDPSAIRSAEGIVGDQYAVACAHGHLPAQDLLVIVATNGDNRDLSSYSGDDLERLFHRVVVRFVDRIDQLVALNIVSSRVEFNLVFRGVGHPSHAN